MQSELIDGPVRRAEVPGLITPEEMREWRHPSGLRLALDLSGPWVQIGAAIAVSALLPHPVVLVLASFVIAGALHGVNCITHEFAHRLVFPGRPRLNDFVGRWFFGAPGALPLHLYRRRHFEHHRFVSTAADTKKLYQRDFAGWRMAREVILGAVGIDYLWQVITVLRRKSEGDPDGWGAFVADVLPVAVVQALIAAVFIWRWDFVHYLI
jgi:fatty acid desaturase